MSGEPPKSPPPRKEIPEVVEKAAPPEEQVQHAAEPTEFGAQAARVAPLAACLPFALALFVLLAVIAVVILLIIVATIAVSFDQPSAANLA